MASPRPPRRAPAEPRHSGVNRRFATLRAVMALILREMATRYGRTAGGYVWAILEPLGAIIILSVGFSLLIRNPPLGNSFMLFYTTGFLPFSLYQNLSNHVARSIDFSRPLLFYPAVTWVDAMIARFILNSLTDMLVMLVLITGILMVIDSRVVINLVPIVSAAGLAALLGLGIGVLNCAISGLFPVWAQVWSILTRPLFLISGIFFVFEQMPTAVRAILWYNPLQHIIGVMRTGFFPTYTADFVSLTYVVSISLVCLFMGVLLMGRYHREILNED